MLGHKVVERLATRFEVTGAVRRVDRQIEAFAEMAGARYIGGLDAANPTAAEVLVAESTADVIVNCVGVIKQREATTQREEMVRVNALFPHVLARACATRGTRLIHLSTDCVFSGARGMYSESDRADPIDFYGLSKLLGEPEGPAVLTIRTSMIGRELRGRHSLLEWFLRQKGPQVRGYVNAIFSGLTNIALADEIGRIIVERPSLHGLYHVSAAPIAKYELLTELKSAFAIPVDIVPDEGPKCDRSLQSTPYQEISGFTAPSWSLMVRDLVTDATPYAELQQLA